MSLFDMEIPDIIPAVCSAACAEYRASATLLKFLDGKGFHNVPTVCSTHTKEENLEERSIILREG